MFAIEFEQRFAQLPKQERDEIPRWLDSVHDEAIRGCQNVDDELHQRNPGMTAAMLNMKFPITSKQREFAEAHVKA